MFIEKTKTTDFFTTTFDKVTLNNVNNCLTSNDNYIETQKSSMLFLLLLVVCVEVTNTNRTHPLLILNEQAYLVKCI